MGLPWRELFVSKVNAHVEWDRWDLAALFITLVITLWLFAMKLKTFYDLGYSSDLFVSVQLARSWLEGSRLLSDNCYGNTLATHTYFLLLPLGLIAKPFGAPGLLFVLSLSAGTAYFAATRVMRILGLAAPVAIILAMAILASPLSVAFYQEAYYGFHVELLTPALSLILFYFLLQRRMGASILMALAVISVKEDAPIVAAMVAIVAGVETWFSSADKTVIGRLNRPALAALILSVAAVPLLLAISAAQPTTIYAIHSVNRLGRFRHGDLSDLASFVAFNLPAWLGSSDVRLWIWVMLVGSFGTILLRPHLLIVGVVATLVAWLRGLHELLWAPRFYPTEALLWCVMLIGFASIARVLTTRRIGPRGVMILAAIVIAGVSARAQLVLVPKARDAYLLRSASGYSAAQRQQADVLFGRYRRESRPQDPVAASPMLFRYTEGRNLFWLSRLYGRPAPIWILSDGSRNFGYGEAVHIEGDMVYDNRNRPMLCLKDYKVVDRLGRFTLLHAVR